MKQNLFYCFYELTIFKEDRFNSFLEHIGKNVQADIFFHHFNLAILKKHTKQQ